MATVVQATPATLLDTLIRRYLKDDLAIRDYVPFVLETITHHRLLHDRNIQDNAATAHQHRIWCQRLRSLLESQQSGARWAGVNFVRITAQQSATLFTDHVRTWVTLLVGLLSKNEPSANAEAIIITLSELFAKTAKRPDLKSDVTSKYLPDFYNHVLSYKNRKELLPTIYNAMTQSVTLFPTTFRLAIDKTEALCVAYMDGRFDQEPELVKAATTCFAALHAAGGKNPNHPTERISPSEQWRNNLQEIIKAMHRTLTVLFATIEEEKLDPNEFVGRNKYFLGLPVPAEDIIQRYPQMFNRLATLSKALIACLTCPTKEAVHLPLNNLVALLTRIFLVNVKTPMSEARGIDPQEYFMLISGVSSMHLSANEILKTLLATAQDHLVRHMSHIASIVIKSVRHSTGLSSGLRSSTYSVVESCIQAFGIPFVNMIQVPLMTALLEDLRMPTARIVNPLEIGAGSNNNPNSRANNHTNTTKQKGGAGKNRRGGNNNNANLSSLNPLEEIVTPQVFTMALNILSLALTTAGPNLQPHARAAADTLVVSHLLNAQHHVNPIEQAETEFYTAPVRAHLYKVLVASVSSPGETQSSLVPLSVGIFKAGLNDSEKFVRDHCLTALTICDLVLHSRMPPMQRARTAVAKKGEKPVQDAGSALFGAFEVQSGKSKKQEQVEDEDEDEEVEEASAAIEEDEKEEDEDVEMAEELVKETPAPVTASSSSSMSAFKAAGEVQVPKATTVTTAVHEETIQKKSDHESTVKITETFAAHSTSSSGESISSSVQTTTTTTTTKTVKATPMSAPASIVSAVDNEDDDDLDIPTINMDDDDSDDDMDSD